MNHLNQSKIRSTSTYHLGNNMSRFMTINTNKYHYQHLSHPNHLYHTKIIGNRQIVHQGPIDFSHLQAKLGNTMLFLFYVKGISRPHLFGESNCIPIQCVPFPLNINGTPYDNCYIYPILSKYQYTNKSIA